MHVFLKKLCSFSQLLSCHRHIGKREDPGDEVDAHAFSLNIPSGRKCPGSPLVGTLKSLECDNKQTKN